MPPKICLMVRSAEGASRTTHGADAKPLFSLCRQFVPSLYPRPALGCRAVNFEPIHAEHGEDFMTMREEYSGIPGTTVFDGDQSRRGYHLNQFCTSLLKPANRDRFKADEEAYLSEWNLTETQKSAVLRRDYNAMIAEGGNISLARSVQRTASRSSSLPRA
jgi:protocatechuate 4,5-dioxygenase, alpha chain